MKYQKIEQSPLGRRRFLGLAGMGAVAAALPSPLWAQAAEAAQN